MYKYYKNGLPFIRKEIEKQRKNLKSFTKNELSDRWLVRDMIYSLHRFGINFTEYFIFKFWTLNSIGKDQYNNLRYQYGLCELVNESNIREIFDDKGKTYDLFKIFYKRDLLSIKNKSECSNFLSFVGKHSSFIVKPLKGVCGRGIQIIRNVANQDAENIFSNLMKDYGEFIVEELIEQGEEMAILHKESINTLRLATFKIKDEIHIYGAAIRMGTGKAIVDNAGSGGIYCHVNCKYGFIDTNAKDYLSNEYVFHPDTNIRFIGFNIPHYDKAIELVKEMAKVLKGATLISWDLAYSKNGWCMVEANDVGEPNLIQSYFHRNKYILEKYIEKYFEEDSKMHVR